MSKESFKSFARKHIELANSVVDGKASWQKLYEIYEIYGENSKVWDTYFSNEDVSNNITGIINKVKDIDMESLQKGIENIQKVLGLVKGLSFGSDKNISNERAVYERFQD